MKQNAPKHFSLQILEAKHSRALGIMKPVWSTMFMKPDELFLMTLYGYSLAANENDSIHEILSDTKNAITRVIFWDTNLNFEHNLHKGLGYHVLKFEVHI